MAPSPPTIIIFGPTGQTACFAARTAHSHGAKIVLAMRDPSKPIPGLPTSEEQRGNYTRVQADLTDPASVATAVKASGATRAFIYFVFGTKDYMRASIEALRDNGVEFVVFLSSSSVGLHTGDRDDVAALRAIPPEAIIPYQHGMVEAELADVFGPGGYVAMRPGYFASNLFRLKDGIAKGEVRIQAPQLTWDCIAPEDIGEVGGVILARGKTGSASSDKVDYDAAPGNVVYLYGPRNRSMEEAIGIIGRALDKAEAVRVTSISKEEMLQQFAQQKMPRPLAEYFVRVQSEDGGSGHDPNWRRPRNEEGVENVRRYTGREATGLEKWVQRNKEGFLS